MTDNRSFYACSVCQPGEDYCEENFKRIVSNQGFVLHRDTPQKGTYEDIEVGDILLLKYNKKFVAYGEVTEKKITDAKGWSNWAMVHEWFFKNDENKEDGVLIFGIGYKTEGGGQYGTVKTIDTKFGLEKVKEINCNTPLFLTIQQEMIQNMQMEQIKNMLDILKYKRQIILQGPPGTGKTYQAKKIAKELAKPNEIGVDDITTYLMKGIEVKTSTSISSFDIVDFTETSINIKLRSANKTNFSILKSRVLDAYKNKIWLKAAIRNGDDTYSAAMAKYVYENLKTDLNIKLVQFHPAYSYEDFVRGITAKTNEISQVEYVVENKTLATYAQRALDNPSSNYVLIIDEINRANLPVVLGELIYALEYRYDEKNVDDTTVDSMYSLKANKDDEEGSTKLKLPKNLYIIGTMNTADRSVGHIDYAIRRRFAFVTIHPSEGVIDEVITDENLKQKAKMLFKEVGKLFIEKEADGKTNKYLAPDFKAEDVQLGHSYFLVSDDDRKNLEIPGEEILKLKLQYEITPLLKEYLKDGVLLPELNIDGKDETEIAITELMKVI